MAKDVEQAVEKVTGLLSDAFEGYNDNDIEINKTVAKFWSKLKKRLPDDVAANFEAKPADHGDTLKKTVTDLANKSPRIQMNLAMFLHDNGVEIE